MPAPVIELRQVTVEFDSPDGPIRALDRADLTVHKADSVAVIGRSGSGKSSLISVIGLMRTPTEGEVFLDGRPLQGNTRTMRAARVHTIGMVFQSFHLEPHLTMIENCMLSWYCTPSRTSMKAARHRAGELADLVGLGHLASRRVSNMSGGERQRVAIARALFSEPRVLIADEPTGNLDEDTAERISTLLWSLSARTGAAVVVVTHDRHVAAGANRIIHLTKGHVSTGPVPAEP